MENGAIWVYTCGCTALAEIDIVVSDGERRRVDLGARRIKATIMEREYDQDGLEEDIPDGEEEDMSDGEEEDIPDGEERQEIPEE